LGALFSIFIGYYTEVAPGSPTEKQGRLHFTSCKCLVSGKTYLELLTPNSQMGQQGPREEKLLGSLQDPKLMAENQRMPI